MPTSHTLTTRPASPAERVIIERQIRTDVPSYGCITIMFGVAPVVLLAAAGGWVARHASPEHELLGHGVGALAGVGVFLSVLLMFIRFERRRHRRAAGDARDNVVQELAVREPRVVEVALVSENAPILAMDI